ncbi:unnamed protein product [Amoebophrya sp. A25]|nr:unnamed protein product [Amoebophrya sp. A25]|eukprot:GSA25T00026931001.1
MTNTDVNGLLGTGKMWLLSTHQLRSLLFDVGEENSVITITKSVTRECEQEISQEGSPTSQEARPLMPLGEEGNAPSANGMLKGLRSLMQRTLSSCSDVLSNEEKKVKHERMLNLLDIGAGCGYITEQLRPLFRGKIVATEVSTQMARRMRRKSNIFSEVHVSGSVSRKAVPRLWRTTSTTSCSKEVNAVADDHHAGLTTSNSCTSSSSSCRRGRDGSLLYGKSPERQLLNNGGQVAGHLEASKFDLIACFNVFDRCQQPRTLLREIRDLCRNHNCRALFGVVFPFEQWVEGHCVPAPPKKGGGHQGKSASSTGATSSADDSSSNSSAAPGSFERIKYRGQAHRKSFEEQAAGFTRQVLMREGFRILKFGRVPYISAGSAKAPLYVLSNGIFLVEPADEES